MATDAAPPLALDFRIADVAREVGVSPSALRLWERQGLIHPGRGPGGARRYSAADIERLRTIHRLRHADGLNAAAIARLLPPGLTNRLLSGVAPIAEIARDARLAAIPGARSVPDPRLGTDGPATGADTQHGRPGGGRRSSFGCLASAGTRRPAVRRDRSRAVDGASASVPTILGPALRAARLERHLTLRAAASAAGLSASFISALERNVTGASLSTLRRLTGVYGTTVAGLLRGPAVGAGRLVRARERRVAEPGDGIRIEDLATSPTQLESQLFVLRAGATSDGYYAHPGEEFMFILDGRLGVWLGKAEYYELGPGDALTFPSTLEHRFRALEPAETRLLWVNTPPTF